MLRAFFLIPLLISFCGIAGCSTDRAMSAGGSLLSASPLVTVNGQTMPANFKIALTGGGVPPKWEIRDQPASPSCGKVIVQTTSDETSYRFPLCIYQPFIAADASASVKFRSISGTVDQAAGLVLRYSDENYYVARANALEDNVNLFKTVNGKRMKILEVPMRVTPNEWHMLKFTARGETLTVLLDGVKAIEVRDDTFIKPGNVGLWTKADSVIAFTDFTIDAAK